MKILKGDNKMLKPAILYKDEIAKGMQQYFYTDDMLYETGCLDNWSPDIADCPREGLYQWAIVNSDDKLVGFLNYHVDFYVSKAYNFGLFSFDRGNPLIGKDLFEKLEELVHSCHRIEWRAVSGNPACRGYDAFIKKHNGKRHVLKDAIKDSHGDYHDDLIYEIVSDIVN